MALLIVSWHLFRVFWLKHFSKFRLPAKGEDTCADCYLLSHQKLSYVAPQKSNFLKQLNNDEFNGITLEDLHAEIEDYDKVINECKKSVNVNLALRGSQLTYLSFEIVPKAEINDGSGNNSANHWHGRERQHHTSGPVVPEHAIRSIIFSLKLLKSSCFVGPLVFPHVHLCSRLRSQMRGFMVRQQNINVISINNVWCVKNYH